MIYTDTEPTRFHLLVSKKLKQKLNFKKIKPGIQWSIINASPDVLCCLSTVSPFGWISIVSIALTQNTRTIINQSERLHCVRHVDI